MKTIRVVYSVLLAGAAVLGAVSPVRAEDRASRSIAKNDADGDGRISRDEWKKRPGTFKEIDTDGDGYLTLQELRARFGETASPGPSPAPAGGPGEALEGRVAIAAVDAETLCAIGRGMRCDIKPAIKRGLFETGLRPRFPDGLDCRGIDERWAIDYSGKRDRVQYHGGIDMPAPYGTPIIAAAAGTVVGRYRGENSFRGRELILRHSPEDTGIPLWIYTQYAHFDEMPAQQVGQRVRMGEILGPTGNSGRGRKAFAQSGRRRPAIHFAVWFSESPNFSEHRDKIIPVNGQWMDPNALYRRKPPFDSYSLKALPEVEKQVPIPVMLDDGTTVPAGTKLVWPYLCGRG